MHRTCDIKKPGPPAPSPPNLGIIPKQKTIFWRLLRYVGSRSYEADGCLFGKEGGFGFHQCSCHWPLLPLFLGFFRHSQKHTIAARRSKNVKRGQGGFQHFLRKLSERLIFVRPRQINFYTCQQLNQGLGKIGLLLLCLAEMEILPQYLMLRLMLMLIWHIRGHSALSATAHIREV